MASQENSITTLEPELSQQYALFLSIDNKRHLNPGAHQKRTLQIFLMSTAKKKILNKMLSKPTLIHHHKKIIHCDQEGVIPGMFQY